MSPVIDATTVFPSVRARRGCALAMLAMLAAPASLAADCMALRWGSDVVLRGVVEARQDDGGQRRRTVVLQLAAPLCVQGFRRDGSPFRYDGIRSVRLGVPAHLDTTLRDGASVVLRGELWWPANADKVELTLALKEVL